LSVFREGGDSVKALLALIALCGVMLLGTASFAATCPESVPAPTYQVGDRFTWNYTNGKERVWEVTGVEGNLTQVKWSDGGALLNSDTAGNYFLDQDWVIRKAVNKNGDELLSPRLGAFAMIGKKFLDFPLHMGKAWNVSYQTRLPNGNMDSFYTNLKVVGCEEVATPAGKFLALKIEAKEVPSHFGGWQEIYWWYSPDARNLVKNEFGRRYGFSGAVTAGLWGPPPQAYELMKLELR
jgi:hypothetical protein